MPVQERSRIVLLASQHYLNKEIADELGIGENKVGRWRNRYGITGTGLTFQQSVLDYEWLQSLFGRH